MCVLVKRQVVHLIEALVALGAIIPALRCVNELMVLVVALLVEALTAILAFPVIKCNSVGGDIFVR